jgi:hypothetical protein
MTVAADGEDEASDTFDMDADYSTDSWAVESATDAVEATDSWLATDSWPLDNDEATDTWATTTNANEATTFTRASDGNEATDTCTTIVAGETIDAPLNKKMKLAASDLALIPILKKTDTVTDTMMSADENQHLKRKSADSFI